MGDSGLTHPLVINAELGIDILQSDNGPAVDHPDAPIASKAYNPSTGDWFTRKSTGWIQDGTTSGGTADWTNITNKPTDVAGYGITDVYTKTASDARYLQLSGGTLSGGLFATGINATDQIRATGWFVSGQNSVGIGTEIGVSGGQGNLIAFDRTNSVYVPLNISGSQLAFSGPATFSSGSLFNGQVQVNSAVLSDIYVVGSHTQGTQIQFGSSSVVAGIGTTYSGGWGYLTYNAIQAAKGTDQWTQVYSPSTSSMLTMQAGGLFLYAAPSSRATGTLAAFWGGPIASIDSAGNAAFAGTMTAAGVGYFGACATSRAAGDVNVRRSSTTGALYFGDGANSYLYFDGTNYTFGGNGGSAGLIVSGTVVAANSLLAQQGRFSGWYIDGIGPAAEIGYSSGAAVFLGYNRSTSTYVPVEIYGSTILLSSQSGTTSVNGSLSVSAALSGYSMTITTSIACGALSVNGYSPTVVRTGPISSGVPGDLASGQLFLGY